MGLRFLGVSFILLGFLQCLLHDGRRVILNAVNQYLLPDGRFPTCDVTKSPIVVKNDNYTEFFFTDTGLSCIKSCYN